MLTLSDIELLEELQHTENGYRLGLAKLMSSCTPLKNSTSSVHTSATCTTQTSSSTRRLVAHHQALYQLLSTEEYEQSYASLVAWLERGTSVYKNYIANYTFDPDTLPVELQLRKLPLQRLNQLYKITQRLEHVPETIVLQYERLVDKARDTIEQQNLRVDLNTVQFDAVKELDLELSSTVAYFKLSDVVERDYFEFELKHPRESQPERLIEIFTLKNGRIALCLVQSMGRSLLHPPLRVSDFIMEQNDSQGICLSNDVVTIKLRCPDQRQMARWNQTFTHLSHQLDHSFFTHHAKLSELKAGKIGLGLHTEQQTMGNSSTLRKSSAMISKHNSLIRNGSQMSSKLSDVNHYFSATNTDLQKINTYTDHQKSTSPSTKIVSHLATPDIKNTESPHMEKLDDLTDYVASIEATFSPESIEVPSLSFSPVAPLKVKKSMQLQNENDSVVSLPEMKHSIGAVQLNKTFAQSVGDLSQVSSSSATRPSHKSSDSSLNSFSSSANITTSTNKTQKDEKKKRRKSLFGLFTKKVDDEPSFEIVTKSSIPASTSTTSISSAKQQDHTQQPLASMASLHRSVQKLDINNKSSKSLPSPFTSSSSSSSTSTTNALQKELTPLEKEILSTSSTSRVITNACIVSRWSQNKWQSIGQAYLNEVQFLHNEKHSTMVIYTDLKSKIPEMFIDLNNGYTTLTTRASSALDLQIRCPQSLDSTTIQILTLRCCDSKTVRTIREEFTIAQEKSQSGGEHGENKSMAGSSTGYNTTRGTLSQSSSMGLFDQAPSNSTSMSSISLIDESWAVPPPPPPPQGKGMYGVPMHSNSTLSFKSVETTQKSTSNNKKNNKINSGLGELLLLKDNVKVRMHKQDSDGDWIPLSMGKLSLASSVTNPDYSRITVRLTTSKDIETLVKNSLCSRLGKSGLRFASIGEDGEEFEYLIEFRNEKECSEIHELLV